MKDIILVVIIVAIVGTAVLYIRKEKKRGVRCVGCSSGGTCSGSCSENGESKCSCDKSVE